MKTCFDMWREVTGDLPWGLQKAFHNALTLVNEDKIRMAWSTDYHNGAPCLVNSVAQMTKAGGGQGIPATKFNALVRAFDQCNEKLYNDSINTTHHVSPFAAEILLQHFGTLKDQPTITTNDPFNKPEITDSEMEAMMDWLQWNTNDNEPTPLMTEQDELDSARVNRQA